LKKTLELKLAWRAVCRRSRIVRVFKKTALLDPSRRILVVKYVRLDRLPPYPEASVTYRKEYGGSSFNRTRLLAANVTQMTPIPATVLNVDKQGGEYLITVQVESGACPGAFDKLGFEIKPDLVGIIMIGLTLFIIGIPASKRGRHSRCGGFNNPSRD
jgi:hypothetical protein